MIYRVFVEKKEQFDVPAAKIRSSIERTLGISPSGVRRLLRYDVEGLTERQMRDSVESVFSEPNTDRVFYDVRVGRDEKMLVVQFLDGQYAAFGKVLEGMDVVDKIAATKTDGNDRPLTEQKIASIRVDTKGEEYPEPDKLRDPYGRG